MRIRRYLLKCIRILACATLVAAHHSVTYAATGERPGAACIGRKAGISISEWVGDSIPAARLFGGKALILDFWATWCGGCIDAMPHMNRIARAYAGKGVSVLTLAVKDRPERVRAFRAKSDMQTWLAIDRGTETYEAFHLRSIPAVFLIDHQGIVRWSGKPGELTATFLDHFLATDSIPPESTPPDPDRRLALAIDIRLSVHRFDMGASATARGLLGLDYQGIPFKGLLAPALSMLGIDEPAIEWIGEAPLEPLFDMRIIGDSLGTRSAFARSLLYYVLDVFNVGYTVQRERRMVHVLRVSDRDALARYRSSRNEDGYIRTERSDEVESVSWARLEDLRRHLVTSFETLVILDVVDSSELNARYTLAYNRNNISHAVRMLEKCGLSLKEEMREVEIHRFDLRTFRSRL